MKKLLKIKEKLSPILKENSDNIRKCTAHLRKLGFVRLNTSATRSSYSGIVFINRRAKIVIKKSYICDRKPVDAVPTVFITEHYSQPWLAQPVVRTLKSYEEYAKPAKWFGEDDLHWKNVGYYRNKLVAIDW